jgi:hypothetical protein
MSEWVGEDSFEKGERVTKDRLLKAHARLPAARVEQPRKQRAIASTVSCWGLSMAVRVGEGGGQVTTYWWAGVAVRTKVCVFVCV